MIFVMTTFNRPEYVRRTLDSLAYSPIYDNDVLYIFDDASDKATTDIIIDFTHSVYKNIFAHFRPKHLGIHTNCTQSLLEAMDRSKSDYAFNIDSDTIFHPKWRDALEKYTQALDIYNNPVGALSLFNTISHPVISDAGNGLLLKKSVGAFGSLFRKEPINTLVDMKVDKDWDWVYLEEVKKLGLPIYCSKLSFLEHIGQIGTNGPVIDKATNFAPIDS